jgi:hypothetical protein
MPEEMLSIDSQFLAGLLSDVSRGYFGLDKANQIQQSAKILLYHACLGCVGKLRKSILGHFRIHGF